MHSYARAGGKEISDILIIELCLVFSCCKRKSFTCQFIIMFIQYNICTQGAAKKSQTGVVNWCVHCSFPLNSHKGKTKSDVFILIGHFTVVCLVAWPLNEGEAGVDLALIETFLLFLC